MHNEDVGLRNLVEQAEPRQVIGLVAATNNLCVSDNMLRVCASLNAII
jgi:hypothetical protein